MVLKPNPPYSVGRNLTVRADIVLNGVPGPGPVDVYGNAYPVNNAVLSGNYHSNGKSTDDVPPSAVLLIAAVGVTIVGDVCGQPDYPGGGQCPHGPLVVTGVDDRDFFASDVHIRENTGYIDPQGYVHLLPLAEAALHARSSLHTWYVDGSSSHNHAEPLTAGNKASTLGGQALPSASITKLPHSRNGSPQYQLSNEDVGPGTLTPVASIDLADWPALAGRAMYFAVDAMVLTNLTGLTLAIDAGDGSGWTYSHRIVAYTEQVGAFDITSFGAIMPVTQNATARFAVNLWGENPAAGKASKAVLGAVAVGLVGAGWSDLVEQAGFAPTGLGMPTTSASRLKTEDVQRAAPALPAKV